MNTEQIQGFLSTKATGKNKYVKIDFKTRQSVYGMFVTETHDYKDLSSKNFWRIVTSKNLEDYNKSKSLSFTRIFNGTEFTKLSLTEAVK